MRRYAAVIYDRFNVITRVEERPTAERAMKAGEFWTRVSGGDKFGIKLARNNTMRLILAGACVALGIYWGEPVNFLMFCLAGGLVLNTFSNEQSKTERIGSNQR